MITNDIVSKLWNLCNILKDDGVTYHQYVTELTYLLFLKMAKETGTEDQLPINYRWSDLENRAAPDRLAFYKLQLIHLGSYGSNLVQEIFANASSFIKKPATLSTLVAEIDKLDWYSVHREDLGDLYGRGSENKVPFIAALSLDDKGHPMRIKLTPDKGFTLKAVAEWAQNNLMPDCYVYSDGLACFGAVSEAGCHHHVIVAGGRKPAELPDFLWINTILGNLKTSLGGAYHAFNFSKYASRYLAAFTYRFNRRFRLDTLPIRLLVAAICCGPRPAKVLRSAELSC